MPGINLAISLGGNPQSRRAELQRLQDTMRHHDSYRSDVLLAEGQLFLGATRYPEYPLSILDRGDHLIVLEGLVYNKSRRQVEEELGSLAVHFAEGVEVVLKARDWILSSFGDYVVLLLDRVRQRLLYLTDALGRLPLYCCQEEGLFGLSREVKFLTGIMPSARYDRQAIAESLLIGNPLGSRTLIEEISRVEAATVGTVDLASGQIRSSVVYEFNLDDLRHADKSVERLAGDLRDLFVEACRDISSGCGDRRQVVSLSGGVDSRAVACGMKLVKDDISAVTFRDPAGVDAAIAEQVARALGIGWQLFETEPFGVALAERIALLKDGLNSITHLLPFFDQLRDTYGSGLVYYTGDGANWSLKKIAPSRKPVSMDMLVDIIIGRSTEIPLAQVASLTGRDEADIRVGIAERVRMYPEQDLSQRYNHFVLYERGPRWLFEGEDRNRCFFWSTTPFFYFPFLQYGLQIPNSKRRMFRLFELFLAGLSPECMGVDYERWGAPFASPRRYLFCYAFGLWESIPPSARTVINHARRRRQRHVRADLKDHLMESLDECPTVAHYLSREELVRILEQGCGMSKLQDLVTLVAYMRHGHDGRKN